MKRDREAGRTRREARERVAAQIKRDLLTMSRKQVAEKYNKSTQTIADIDDGVNFANVKPAAQE